MLIHHTFPLDAEYDFALGGRGGGPGGGIDITLDGEQVKVDNPRSFRLKVSAGPHTIGLSLPDRQRGAGVDEIYSDFRTNAVFTNPGGVPNLVITGPHNITGVGDTPSRRKIFTCRPASAGEETSCARSILTTLARRAYRGPVSAAEIDTLMEFYREGTSGRRLRIGHPGSARPRARCAALRLSRRGRTRDRCVGSGLSRQRCRPRLAALLLPVEQHSRRRAAGRRDQGTAARSEGARPAGQAHARRREGGRARRELRRSVALSARARSRADGSQEFRREPPPVVPSRDRAALQDDRARRSQSHRSHRRRLHVRGRAAGPSLRHPQHPGKLLPARAASRRTARAADCSDRAAC